MSSYCHFYSKSVLRDSFYPHYVLVCNFSNSKKTGIQYPLTLLYLPKYMKNRFRMVNLHSLPHSQE